MDQPDLPLLFDHAVPEVQSVDLALYGGVYTRLHTIPQAGTFVPQHAHGYDHQTLVVAGAFLAWQDGVRLGVFRQGEILRIPAGALHTFQALADGSTFACIHSVDLWEETEEHQLPGVLRDGSALRDDGVVFQQEPLDRVLTEGEALISQHSVYVGEAPGSLHSKNLPLWRKLAEAGIIHVTTARQGAKGPILGYLMAITSPSLEIAGQTEGMHTSFFTDPSVPGLAIRLQRAGLEYLRSIGVSNVTLRVGHLGNRHRFAVLFERLGAKRTGELWMVDFREPG